MSDNNEAKVILVVASKVKAYAKEKDISVSAEAMVTLTDIIKSAIDKAAEEAKAAGRVTIKAKDFKFV